MSSPVISLFHDPQGWKITIEISGKMTKENVQYIEEIIRSLEEKDEQALLEVQKTDGRKKNNHKKVN
jgi:hypothetical protein